MTPSFSVRPSCLISTAKIKVALRYKGSASAIARARDVAFPARWKISGRIRITVETQHCKRKRPPWWRRGRTTEAEVKQGERTGIHSIALTTASWDKSFLIMNTNHFYLCSSEFRVSRSNSHDSLFFLLWTVTRPLAIATFLSVAALKTGIL